MSEGTKITMAEWARQRLIQRETWKEERRDEEILAEYIRNQPEIPKAGKLPEKLKILKDIYAECQKVFYFIPEIQDVYLYVFPEREALRTGVDGISVWVNDDDVAIGLAETILTKEEINYAKSVLIHELVHIILKDGHTADFAALWQKMIDYFNQENGTELRCDRRDKSHRKTNRKDERRDGEVIHKSDQTYREEKAERERKMQEVREREAREEPLRAAARRKQAKYNKMYSRIVEKLKGVVEDGKNAGNALAAIEGGNEQLIEAKFKTLSEKESFSELGQNAENMNCSLQEKKEIVCQKLRQRVKRGKDAARDLEAIEAGDHKTLSKYLSSTAREMESPSEKVEKAFGYKKGRVDA